MDLSRVVEEKIQAAMQAGEFDNLPGRGQPLSLEVNPFEAEEAHLTNHLLRSNNMVFPWMERGVEIEKAIFEFREKASSHLACVSPGNLQQFKNDLLSQINTLNYAILDYNLRVPAPVFQKPALDFETELKKISG